MLVVSGAMATLENLLPTGPNASGLIYETIILQYDSGKLQDEAESFYLSCDNTTYCTEYSTCRTLVCSFTEAVALKQTNHSKPLLSFTRSGIRD